jgi:hypothetical protein
MSVAGVTRLASNREASPDSAQGISVGRVPRVVRGCDLGGVVSPDCGADSSKLALSAGAFGEGILGRDS